MHAIPVLCNVYWIVELLRVVVIIRILQVSILVNPDTENILMAGWIIYDYQYLFWAETLLVLMLTGRISRMTKLLRKCG